MTLHCSQFLGKILPLRFQLSCSDNNSSFLCSHLASPLKQRLFQNSEAPPETGRETTWKFQSMWGKYDTSISNYNNLRDSEFHRVRQADAEPFSNQSLPLSKGKLSIRLWSFTDPNPWDGARSGWGPPRGALLVPLPPSLLLKLHWKATDSKLYGLRI